ncbi:MAG TPA: serine/threonine-protein kinase [Myxococcota bacterium]|nr:serine/threonine-protein kinase [Myxococcota bacterium]
MSANLVGQTIGNHKVVARLGEGGMGVVYLAEHALLGRKAAIKVLHPEFSQRPDVVNRFFNEARASAKLKHPGIIEIYDFGTLPDHSAYIVMEFLEGEALATRLSRERALGVADAVAITHQMAKALQAAHAKGIVHRDLKPDNVFIVPDPENPGRERIKVLDFGIAKLSEEAGGMGKKTRTGALLGTPAYMSPEQCEGAGYVDHRSDIYSMGIMLYEMLCGQVPFMAEGFGKILAMHMHADPMPPRALDPRIPEAVEDVVLQMLVKDKAQRLQTCADVAQAIEAVEAQIALFAHASGAASVGSTFRAPVPTGASGTFRSPDAGAAAAAGAVRATPAPPAPSTTPTAQGVKRPVAPTPAPRVPTPAPAPRAPTPAPSLAHTTPAPPSGIAPDAPTHAGATFALADVPDGPTHSGGTVAITGAATAVPSMSEQAAARRTTLSGGATTTLQPAIAPAPGGRRGLVLAAAAVLVLGAAGGVGFLMLGNGDGGGTSAGSDDDPATAARTDGDGAGKGEGTHDEGGGTAAGKGAHAPDDGKGEATETAAIRTAKAPLAPATAGPAPATAATAAPEAAAAPTGAPAPRLVRFEFVSTPKKAKVYRLPENELVGETPCKVPAEAAAGDVSFAVRRAGYEDATVKLSGSDGGKADVKLKKARGDGDIKPVRDGIKPVRDDVAPVH